ncbi:MAG TPA: hypothetical protein VFR93_07830 [Candidatus Limnocylindrales bacterium]|nr:hypothetical protein [Candidatus Limnocylindrales bacterium]
MTDVTTVEPSSAVPSGGEGSSARPGRLAAARHSPLGRLAALLVGGALVGYVVTAFAASFLATGALTGRPAEPIETRAYLKALLARDATELAALQPPVDLGARAAQLQQSALAQRWNAQALSYLGGVTEGPIGVFVYVIDVTSPDGSTEQTVPFAFTVVDRRIVRVQ